MYYAEGDERIEKLRKGITFMSYKCYRNTVCSLEGDQRKKTFVIIDEFDSIIFDETYSITVVKQSFDQLDAILAFTGSDL